MTKIRKLTKVLTATKAGQGQRPSDFCHTAEGELVGFVGECDSDFDVDDRCGCRRSFGGLLTGKATTTVMVRLIPNARQTLTKHVGQSYEQYRMPGLFSDAEVDEMIKSDVDELLRLAELFDEHTVLEKRGRDINARGKAKVERKVH